MVVVQQAQEFKYYSFERRGEGRRHITKENYTNQGEKRNVRKYIFEKCS